MLGNFAGGLVVKNYPIRYVFLLSSLPISISFLMFLFFHENAKKPMDFRMLFRYDRPGRMDVSFKSLKSYAKRNRNILIFSFSTFVLMLSSGMVYSYLSLLIAMRFGEDYVGFYYGIDGLFSSFFIYPFGYISDRIGSKIVIIFGSFLYLLTFAMYYVAVSLPLLMVTALVSGTKWAAYFNSINTYVSRMSTSDERATALGVMNGGVAAGWVFGPLLGAYIISVLGLANMMLVAMVPVVVSMIILIPFTKNDRAPSSYQ